MFIVTPELQESLEVLKEVCTLENLVSGIITLIGMLSLYTVLVVLL